MRKSWDLCSSNALPPSTLKELGKPFFSFSHFPFCCLMVFFWKSFFGVFACNQMGQMHLLASQLSCDAWSYVLCMAHNLSIWLVGPKMDQTVYKLLSLDKEQIYMINYLTIKSNLNINLIIQQVKLKYNKVISNSNIIM